MTEADREPKAQRAPPPPEPVPAGSNPDLGADPVDWLRLGRDIAARYPKTLSRLAR